jgi:hypothetical protein
MAKEHFQTVGRSSHELHVYGLECTVMALPAR